MSASWPGKTDNWQNVLCNYDPICAQIMAIKTWYYQNWDRYMCGFLITSTTSDCAIVEKYVSKHVNLVTGLKLENYYFFTFTFSRPEVKKLLLFLLFLDLKLENYSVFMFLLFLDLKLENYSVFTFSRPEVRKLFRIYVFTFSRPEVGKLFHISKA